FDGVHRGHRLLLDQALQRARESDLDLVVVTFDPNPAVVLRPGLRRYQLSGPKIKLRLLAEFEPACVLMLPFTLELSRLSAGEFMDALESRLVVRELWLGEDFRFGRGREGDSRLLAERGERSGFVLHSVERHIDDPTGISSSRVRRALAAGDMDLTMRLLGYPFCLEPGEANAIETIADRRLHRYAVEDDLAIPADGAYAVLLSDGSGPPAPAACTVEDGAPFPLSVLSEYAPAGPCTIEFIAKLDDDGASPATLDRDYSRAIVVAGYWTRPVYPPAGHL
ncbi:MAG: hypothetical protein ACRDIE_17715, partial [Chloroflexota bacterium]